MKPTLEQVQEWRAMAYRYADKQTGDYNEADEIAQEKFAELAAQWGAEQAQHEAKNAPWLTTAHVICTDAGITHGPISERLEALRDKLADKAQQTTEETDAEMALRSIASWLGVGGFNAPAVDAKVFERKIYEGVEMAIKSHYVAAEEPELPERYDFVRDTERGVTEDVYTATQMHDHFHAGVRSAMVQQSQDAKRYRWLRGSGFAHANVDLGTDLDGDNFVRYQIRFDIPEPAHSKFEDDEWSASDIDAAIDAAMQGGKQ